MLTLEEKHVPYRKNYLDEYDLPDWCAAIACSRCICCQSVPGVLAATYIRIYEVLQCNACVCICIWSTVQTVPCKIAAHILTL